MNALIKPILTFGLCLSFLYGTPPSTGLANDTFNADTAKALTNLTGGRVKAVWISLMNLTEFTTVYGGQGGKDGFQISVFDTKDAKTRVLVKGPSGLCGAWITPDGKQVVYSDVLKKTTSVINWDGSNNKVLQTNDYCYVLHVNTESASGITWVYVSNHHVNADLIKKMGGKPTPRGDKVYRFRLDDPSHRELVWNKSWVDLNYRVSLDGKRAGGGWPWPRQGVGTMPLGDVQIYGKGCNASIAPDTSYKYFYMQGNHRFINFFDYGDPVPRTINVQVPNNKGLESWLPRWTNRTPYMTIAGPIAWQGDGRKKAEIWFAKFDASFSKVERWIKITNNDTWDTGASAWVENAGEVDPNALSDSARTTINELLDQPNLTKAFKSLHAKSHHAKGEEKESAITVVNYLTRWAESNMAKAQAMAEQHPDKARDILKLVATKFEGHELSTAATKLASSLASTWPLEHYGNPPLLTWANSRTGTKVPGMEGIFPRQHAESHLGRFQADLRQGWMQFTKSGKAIKEHMTKATGFTFEATISPVAKAQQGLATIATSASSESSANFSLMEQDDLLLFQLRTANNDFGIIPLQRITGTGHWDVIPKAQTKDTPKPFHLAVTYDGATFSAYVNGTPIKTLKTSNTKASSTPFSNWGDYDLIVGGTVNGKRQWQGKLEGIALHARALSPEEVNASAQGYAKMSGKYPSTPRTTVKATLKARADFPQYKTIAPYYQALTVHHYEVNEVISGQYETKDLFVATWTMKDAKQLNSTKRTIGDVSTFTVEHMDAHPHLEPEFLADMDRDIDSELYLELPTN